MDSLNFKMFPQKVSNCKTLLHVSATIVHENYACLKIFTRNLMVFKLHDRPDPLNFHSFPRDQSVVGLSQGSDFTRAGSRRSSPVYSCIPSWPVTALWSPSLPPFSPWLFLYWYSVIPAFYFYLVSPGFSYHSVPLTLYLISLILNSKALFLTTNWKARGTSSQCKPKFIIFLTKPHFLSFLSHSVAPPSIHLAETWE